MIQKFRKEEVLHDYRIACESRQASLAGRREVLSGKGKFGIFGDGKEVPQLALSKVFREGDWRTGYYRDQTWMLASGLTTLEELFSQVYGDTDPELNTVSAGRLMNSHFASRSLDENGKWADLTKQKNSACDLSPTAGQMPRLTGLGLVSKLFRQNKDLQEFATLSNQGNEVAFATIGDASTSEGHFWETVNAAGVLQIPVAIFVWDDGYGISVPSIYQTTKQSISEALKGFEREKGKDGILIYSVKGWDYAALCRVFDEGVAKCRAEHVPVLFHVTELTQPQGHSSSGSHERYKSREQLEWEKAFDCNLKMREWIASEKIASPSELDSVEKEAIQRVKQARHTAWNNFMNPILKKRNDFLHMADVTTCNCAKTAKIESLKKELKQQAEPTLKDLTSTGRKILRLICNSCSNPDNSLKTNITNWIAGEMAENQHRYSSHLYNESENSALKVQTILPVYKEDSLFVPGREILRKNWDHILENDKKVCIFGEDVGKIGGVNQTYEGLQAKFGEARIFDTGIREATIIGQGIGMAMRGLRPVAEIQYFDYLIYALEVMSDDLATLHYRTRGGQSAPLVITTRGHRLEGIWHSGSPLSMVINSIRGIYVLVPRNMTQAAGFYNTLMKSGDPALVIEPLNGYRLRERLPSNIGEYYIIPGIPEIISEGTDITLVTYGSCVRIAQDAVAQLRDFDISVELIDVQSLLPFDNIGLIGKSLRKTNKIVFFDEDVPGGATSYMMQQVLEEQHGYNSLDAEPKTVTAQAHRAAYSSDGDYFSNPNAEDVFDTIYNLMHDSNPGKYPKIF